MDDAELIEKLSELEHDQWSSWARAIKQELVQIRNHLDCKNYGLAKEVLTERIRKWDENLYEYKFLYEPIKEKDRVWARKALEILRSHS